MADFQAGERSSSEDESYQSDSSLFTTSSKNETSQTEDIQVSTRVTSYGLTRMMNSWTKLQEFIFIWMTMQTSSFLAGPGWMDADRDLKFKTKIDLAGRMQVFDQSNNEVSGPKKRREWKVGIGYTTFQPLNKLGVKDLDWRQLFAHWGVYIRNPDGNPREPNYKVYSMNFDGPLGKDLVMEAIWSTHRGWKRKMYGHEVPKVTVNGNIEQTFYFCIEEFEVAAQIYLQDFLRHHRSPGNYLKRGRDWMINHAISGKNGDLYKVLSMNCQDFSEFLIDCLKMNGWDNPQRINEEWDARTWTKESFQLPQLCGSQGTKRGQEGADAITKVALVGCFAAACFTVLWRYGPYEHALLVLVCFLSLKYFTDGLATRYGIPGRNIGLCLMLILEQGTLGLKFGGPTMWLGIIQVVDMASKKETPKNLGFFAGLLSVVGRLIDMIQGERVVEWPDTRPWIRPQPGKIWPTRS